MTVPAPGQDNPQVKRDPFADDVLQRLVKSNQDYQRAHGHYIVPLAQRLLDTRLSLEAASRKVSCDYETGQGQNCGKCNDCLRVNEFFLKDAVGNLRAALEAATRERDGALAELSKLRRALL